MKLRANLKNLKANAESLLGNNYDEGKEKLLIDCALNGFVRTYGHISHDRAKHLEDLNKILGNCGVEGMLLDERGEDCSGSGDSRDVEYDIQYSNTGDSYAMTLFYLNGILFIGDWGSIVENIPGQEE